MLQARAASDLHEHLLLPQKPLALGQECQESGSSSGSSSGSPVRDFPWGSRGREEMGLLPLWESTEQDQSCSCGFFLLSVSRMPWSAPAQDNLRVRASRACVKPLWDRMCPKSFINPFSSAGRAACGPRASSLEQGRGGDEPQGLSHRSR